MPPKILLKRPKMDTNGLPISSVSAPPPPIGVDDVPVEASSIEKERCDEKAQPIDDPLLEVELAALEDETDGYNDDDASDGSDYSFEQYVCNESIDEEGEVAEESATDERAVNDSAITTTRDFSHEADSFSTSTSEDEEGEDDCEDEDEDDFDSYDYKKGAPKVSKAEAARAHFYSDKHLADYNFDKLAHKHDVVGPKFRLSAPYQLNWKDMVDKGFKGSQHFSLDNEEKVEDWIVEWLLKGSFDSEKTEKGGEELLKEKLVRFQFALLKGDFPSDDGNAPILALLVAAITQAAPDFHLKFLGFLQRKSSVEHIQDGTAHIYLSYLIEMAFFNLFEFYNLFAHVCAFLEHMTNTIVVKNTQGEDEMVLIVCLVLTKLGPHLTSEYGGRTVEFLTKIHSNVFSSATYYSQANTKKLEKAFKALGKKSPKLFPPISKQIVPTAVKNQPISNESLKASSSSAAAVSPAPAGGVVLVSGMRRDLAELLRKVRPPNRSVLRPILPHKYDTGIDRAFFTNYRSIESFFPPNVDGKRFLELYGIKHRQTGTVKIGSQEKGRTPTFDGMGDRVKAALPLPQASEDVLHNLLAKELCELSSKAQTERWITAFLKEASRVFVDAKATPGEKKEHFLICRERLIYALKFPTGTTLPKCPEFPALIVAMFEKSFFSFVNPIFLFINAEINTFVRCLIEGRQLSKVFLGRMHGLVRYYGALVQFERIDMMAITKHAQRLSDCLADLFSAPVLPRKMEVVLPNLCQLAVTFYSNIGPFILRIPKKETPCDTKSRNRLETSLTRLDDVLRANARGAKSTAQEWRVVVLQALDELFQKAGSGNISVDPSSSSREKDISETSVENTERGYASTNTVAPSSTSAWVKVVGGESSKTHDEEEVQSNDIDNTSKEHTDTTVWTGVTPEEETDEVYAAVQASLKRVMDDLTASRNESVDTKNHGNVLALNRGTAVNEYPTPQSLLLSGAQSTSKGSIETKESLMNNNPNERCTQTDFEADGVYEPSMFAFTGAVRAVPVASSLPNVQLGVGSSNVTPATVKTPRLPLPFKGVPFSALATPLEQFVRWLLFANLNKSTVSVVQRTMRQIICKTLCIAAEMDEEAELTGEIETPYNLTRDARVTPMYPQLSLEYLEKGLLMDIIPPTEAGSNDVDQLDAALTFVATLSCHHVAATWCRDNALVSAKKGHPSKEPAVGSVSCLARALILFGQVLRESQQCQFDLMSCLAQVMESISSMPFAAMRSLMEGATASDITFPIPVASTFSNGEDSYGLQIVQAVVLSIRSSLREDLAHMSNAHHRNRLARAIREEDFWIENGGEIASVRGPSRDDSIELDIATVDSQAMLSDLRYYAELCVSKLVPIESLMELLQEIILFYPNTTIKGNIIEVFGVDHAARREGRRERGDAYEHAWVSRRDFDRLSPEANSFAATLHNYFVANADPRDVSRIRYVCAILESILPHVITFCAPSQGAAVEFSLILTPSQVTVLQRLLGCLFILIYSKDPSSPVDDGEPYDAEVCVDRTRIMSSDGACLPFDLENKLSDVLELLVKALTRQIPREHHGARQHIQESFYPKSQREAARRYDALLTPAWSVAGGVPLLANLAVHFNPYVLLFERSCGEVMKTANSRYSPFPLPPIDEFEAELLAAGLVASRGACGAAVAGGHDEGSVPLPTNGPVKLMKKTKKKAEVVEEGDSNPKTHGTGNALLEDEISVVAAKRAEEEAAEEKRVAAALKAQREEELEKAKQEEEERQRRIREEKALQEAAEQKIKREADAKAKKEMEEKARREAAEAKAKKEAAERAAREAEERAKREAEAKARKEAAEAKKLAAEVKAKQDAAEKAAKILRELEEADKKAKEAAASWDQRIAEEKLRREEAAKARKMREELVLKEALEKAAKEAKEAEERRKLAAMPAVTTASVAPLDGGKLKIKKKVKPGDTPCSGGSATSPVGSVPGQFSQSTSTVSSPACSMSREPSKALNAEEKEKALAAVDEKSAKETIAKARRDAEEKAKLEADAKVKREAAEAWQRQAAEAKAKREAAEAKAQKEAEETLLRDLERTAENEAKERGVLEVSEVKARKEVVETARKDAEEMTAREKAAKAKRAVDERFYFGEAERLSRSTIFEECLSGRVALLQMMLDEKASILAEDRARREILETALAQLDASLVAYLASNGLNSVAPHLVNAKVVTFEALCGLNTNLPLVCKIFNLKTEDDAAAVVALAEQKAKGDTLAMRRAKALQISKEIAASVKPNPQADAARLQGNKLIKEGNLAGALVFYNKAISFQPNAITFSNRSHCYFLLNDFSKAYEDAKACFKLDATNVKYAYRVIKALMGLKRYAKALAFTQERLVEYEAGDRILEDEEVEMLREVCAKAAKLKSSGTE